MLREPNPHVPQIDDASIAAAVHLERLVEEPTGTSNPPMTRREARAVSLALLRLQMRQGLTPRMRALHQALLAYTLRPSESDDLS
jgi:hypothetical protein